MDSLKQLLSVLSVLAATAAGAAPVENVLTLSVARSTLFTRDVPKLSLSNGQLSENEATVGVAIDRPALVALLATYKDRDDESEFYREARNFRDGRATFEFKHVDGTVTRKTFILDESGDDDAVVALPELLVDARAEVTGTVDVYKCFNADTCVLEGTRAENLYVEGNFGNKVKQNFRGLVGCHSDARIEGGVDHPEIQRIVINRRIARNMGVDEFITAKAEPVLHGQDFQGFTANLENFGLAGGGLANTTMEVTRENDDLVIRVLTRGPNGVSFRTGYTFENCGNYP